MVVDYECEVGMALLVLQDSIIMVMVAFILRLFHLSLVCMRPASRPPRQHAATTGNNHHKVHALLIIPFATERVF